LLHRPIERDGQQKFAFNDEYLLARESRAESDHFLASKVEARVDAFRSMQGHTRILLRQVSASGDCDIFRNRTSHARASRLSAAMFLASSELEPAAFMDARVVTPTTRASKIRCFFMG
jgi:hypothetical protein